MRARTWLIAYFAVILTGLAGIAGMTGGIDPYFHYHKPLKSFFYILDNQRSQNDGILKHFDYDAVIIGTSMVENFRATELDELFGVTSVKVPYEGATFREINGALETALRTHPGTRMVVRALDMSKFRDDKDELRDDMGVYPRYLYNDNPLDDVRYLFNRSVIFKRCLPILAGWLRGVPGGITDFDHYGYWMTRHVGDFGKHSVLADIGRFKEPAKEKHLGEEDREVIRGNIQQNVVELCRKYPDVTFYIYLPPYSAAWWGRLYQRGTLFRQIEAEQFVIEQLLECENIRVFSLNTRTDITADLNQYKDLRHHGEAVNSLILQSMKEGRGLLTRENYLEYIEEEKRIYSTFDYNSLFDQEDAEDPAPMLAAE